MPGASRITTLELRVNDFERAVASFQTMRARLLERRQNATDSAMLRIDEMLTLNSRTITSLTNALESAQRELAREQNRSASAADAGPQAT